MGQYYKEYAGPETDWNKRQNTGQAVFRQAVKGTMQHVDEKLVGITGSTFH